MPPSFKSPHRVWDDQAMTAGVYRSGRTILAGWDQASWQVMPVGTLAGTLQAEVSNSTDEDIRLGRDRWAIYTPLAAVTVSAAARTPDVDEMEFVPASGSADLTAAAATAAALPACTASGTGVGKTLTANAVGILTVDGVALVLNDLVLVKNQANRIDNGFYKVTTAGTAGVAFILTRSTSFDAVGETTLAKIIDVTAGTVNAGTSWRLAVEPIVIRCAPHTRMARLRFTVTSGTGSVTAYDTAKEA